MPITIALPLDLPEVQVLASRLLEDGTLLIEVESTLQTARCYGCGREIDRFHGYDRPIRSPFKGLVQQLVSVPKASLLPP